MDELSQWTDSTISLKRVRAMNDLMETHRVSYLRSLLQSDLQVAAEACFSLCP